MSVTESTFISGLGRRISDVSGEIRENSFFTAAHDASAFEC